MTKRDLPKVNVAVRPGVRSDFSDVALKRWSPDLRSGIGADDASEISILDPIGDDFWGDAVSAKTISRALQAAGADADVVVNINSPGGNFFDGLAIYNLLREHKGHVTVKILGIAASAAAVIAMAADEVLIARAAFLMIHNTWVGAAGDRHALRDVADWLEPFDEASVSIFAARSGLDGAELAKMLDTETWIGGASAVEQGFADGLLDDDQVTSVANMGEATPMAAQKKLDLVLATGKRLPKSERRELYAALKGGKSRAAPTGMSGAAVSQFAQDALTKLNSI